MAHVLVIEDDPAIRSSLIRSLSDRGHAVTSAPNGLDGLRQALDGGPDLVLLDLGLPDLDGHSVLSMLRAVRDTPVIVITARDDDPSVVKALDAGADDYVVKPFGTAQLEARMRAVLRRSGTDGPLEPMTVGGLTVDPTAREAALHGRVLDLSRREFDLLAYLVQHEGEVVSKRDVLADVWNQPYGGGERTVDVHLSWLRRKLGESAAAPVYLHSVRGVGVRLTAPATDAADPDATRPDPDDDASG
ncbi:response regulator transcription factor [Phycicoccus sp. HDW14]|uniref:response regulator transcription factor n=1 Tax=Phycicoccus sp. HDW14 TaxID=2714941 RepID=UPI00140E3B68|nr:response regulator transcription factor [Phycicoccus sp. HDW14]QIM20519.1 response regulator transcription factor [Phycicoccus sp. HDW14]